jgi:hypothetical protein
MYHEIPTFETLREAREFTLLQVRETGARLDPLRRDPATRLFEAELHAPAGNVWANNMKPSVVFTGETPFEVYEQVLAELLDWFVEDKNGDDHA